MSDCRRRNRLVSNALALAMGALAVAGPLSLPAVADEILNNNCLNTVSGAAQNCTANDGPLLTLTVTSYSQITAGCVNQTDSAVLAHLRFELQQQQAGTRYDIGNWINSDGTSAASGLNGTCSRFGLFPSGVTSPTTCPPWDLGGNATTPAYANEDGDACGDIDNYNNRGCDLNSTGSPWDDSIYDTLNAQPLTVKCADPTVSAGFVQVPYCQTWSQQKNQVCDPTVPGTCTCTSAANFGLGTVAKCLCGNTTTNIPAPHLALSCSCSANAVKPGQYTACTVSFTNTIAACSPSGTLAENMQCGSAAYLQFNIANQSTAVGSFYTGTPPTGSVIDTTNGAQPVLSSSQILWTPRNNSAYGTSLGIIGPNYSSPAYPTGASLTFYFQVSPTATPSATPYTIANVGTFWYNTAPNQTTGAYSGTATDKSLALSTACQLTVQNATWASVVNVRAARENGRVALRWDTAAEAGTHAFEIERKDAKTGKFVKVTEHALPALSSLPGGSYRWIDESAPAGASTLTYRIVELEQSGGRQTYGPFTVAVEREGLRNAVAASDAPFAMKAKGVSARVLNAAVAAVAAARSGPRTGDAAPTRVKLETVGAGMVRVDATAIAAALRRPLAQVSAQLVTGRLALSHLGSAVAWQPTPDGAGLAFYAQAVNSAYTDSNVYWIDLGSAGTPIQSESVSAPLSSDGAVGSFAESLHLEEDRIGGIVSPTPVADYWIWQSLAPGYPGYDTANLTVAVPHPVAGGSPRLALTLYGFALEQEVELHVNGRYIDTISWSTPGRYIADVALPDDVLVDGANSVEIVGRQGSGGIWLDSMDLQYRRALTATGDRLGFTVGLGEAVAVGGFSSGDISVFDLTDPAHPQLLSGARTESTGAGGWRAVFVAPSDGPFVATTSAAMLAPAATRGRAVVDLRAASNAAQYVVISPIELRSQANRLADWRSQQGLSAKVVDLEDVMDQFADGAYDPLAIKRFLANARQSWQTAPRYVALLGKGSFDYKNTLGLHSNLLPPLLVPTGDAVAPADAEYADFDGNGVPEMAVGRIPALTVAEAKAYVDKLIAYESSSPGKWAGRALMVADNPDKAGSFQAESDTLASSLTASGTAISRVYLPSPASAAQLLTARNQLLSGFNTGFGLLNYVGHGGLDRLATEGLLLTTDVPQLGNGPRLPVMTALTCLISQFAYPTFSSLGEDLVLQPSGGVVALYGPTWLSYDGEANRMGGYVVPEVERAGTDRLGDRLLHGLAAYAQSGSDRVQLSVYTLLGDPAVRPPQ